MIEGTAAPPIDHETFERHAEALAAMHQPAPCRGSARHVHRRIAAVREGVRSLYARLPSDERRITNGQRWLLDNDYLVLRTLRQADEDVSDAFYRVLPCVKQGTGRLCASPD